ncbi:hypothetical protein B0J18DRAFT_21219 [Chaetomium sp. MPI-SDFR-AT-0129]|nr:hypothetical protein B0J18DRAFT_21219 [Chaetomium sp. MPI-SDFR-AT-0129]
MGHYRWSVAHRAAALHRRMTPAPDSLLLYSWRFTGPRRGNFNFQGPGPCRGNTGSTSPLQELQLPRSWSSLRERGVHMRAVGTSPFKAEDRAAGIPLRGAGVCAVGTSPCDANVRTTRRVPDYAVNGRTVSCLGHTVGTSLCWACVHALRSITSSRNITLLGRCPCYGISPLKGYIHVTSAQFIVSLCTFGSSRDHITRIAPC